MTRRFRFTSLMAIGVCLVTGCQGTTTDNDSESEKIPLTLQSTWVKEQNNEVLLDPQTSGLALWRDGSFLSIADGSAHQSQVLKLLRIDPQNSQIVLPKLPISLSAPVANGCFAEFMSVRPDLEALVVDPDDDSVFYTVTEDASKHTLSDACKSQYADTGATDYPTLLVRLALNEAEQSVLMTHVRPIQYSADMNIGNHPNDGIEGMTFGEGRRLYLALEMDDNYQPRIFSVEVNDEFWQSEDFYPVTDEKLKLPVFTDKKPHPINGLSWYKDGQTGWLVAAARNDNQLWLIDAAGKKETVKIPLRFMAETESNGKCAEFELMHNYSMEGLAVKGDKLWLINDPWKQNYKKNIQCPETAANYEKMAPLLTSIPLSTIDTYLQK